MEQEKGSNDKYWEAGDLGQPQDWCSVAELSSIKSVTESQFFSIRGAEQVINLGEAEEPKTNKQNNSDWVLEIGIKSFRFQANPRYENVDRSMSRAKKNYLSFHLLNYSSWVNNSNDMD